MHHNVHTGLDIDPAGVKADRVVIGISHFAAGIFLVIGPALQIPLLDIFIQPHLSVLPEVTRALHAVLHRRVQINGKRIDPGFPQDVVRTPPHNDAGTLGQLQNDLLLCLEDLIVAAAVFTAGMMAMGLTSALIGFMKGSESIAQIAGAFGPFIIAIISGSGDAAALAFNGAITPHATDFGMTIMNLGSLAQMTGAIGRSMSPVAGAAIVCAGLAKVSPMEMTKRNALPMLASVIAFMVLFG